MGTLSMAMVNTLGFMVGSSYVWCPGHMDWLILFSVLCATCKATQSRYSPQVIPPMSTEQVESCERQSLSQLLE